MRVTAVETLRLPERQETLWVSVETDEGLTGLGETTPRPGLVEQAVHGLLAPLLIGSEAAPEAFWQRAFQSISYHGASGAELRALSAVDIALWDLVGQAAGLPVHRLFGGPCRTSAPVYNTCVSHDGIRDHERFRADPGELARELVAEGYVGMKIWPFDDLSTETGGHRADRRRVAEAARTLGSIRDAVGDAIEVAVEGHGCWSLPAAIVIAQEVEQFRPMWLEDLIPLGDPAAWRELRSSTSTPICGSERALGRAGITPYLDTVDIVNQDLCWTGGFTEFVKIAAMADSRALPVAPHNCHGPVGAMATLHASLAVPNLFLMESVRSFERGFFDEIVEGASIAREGRHAVPERPGLGVRLRPAVRDRAAVVRSSVNDVAAVGWGAGDPWAGRLGDRV